MLSELKQLVGVLVLLLCASLAAVSALAEPARVVLFDGQLAETWVPNSVAGGSFDRFAKLDDNTLVVDVPAGNSWGKTGIWSPQPVIVFDRENTVPSAQILTVTYDPARTDGVVIGLASGAGQDDRWAHDARLHWFRDAERMASLAFTS